MTSSFKLLLILLPLVLTGCSSAVQSTALAAASPWAQVPSSQWVELETEPYKGKRDHIHFVNSRTGVYGTGAGDFFRTDDGGASWTKLWIQKGTFIRAVGFIDPMNGFIGNVGDYYPGVTDRTPL